MKTKVKSKRLNLLSQEEIELYFGPPQFSNIERPHYFSMSDDELALTKTLSASTQWYFILQLGYFKAKKQFFIIFHQNVKHDINFITETYQCRKPRKIVSEDTHRKVRQMILSNLNFSDDLHPIKMKLTAKANDIVCSTNDPKAIFKSLYDCAIDSKWIVPQYSTFQGIISSSLKQEELRLQNALQKLLPQYAVKAMNKLLSSEKQYYEMTDVSTLSRTYFS